MLHKPFFSKLAVAIAAVALSGCTLFQPTVESASLHPEQTSASQTGPDQTPTPTADLSSVFAELPDQFIFSSGAGGWQTTLVISKDGSFSGRYMDSDMGDIGPQYPNGTEYDCVFSGQFQVIAQVSQFEYTLTLVTLTQEGTPDDVSYSDGIRHIIATPYGFDDAQNFSLYRPGRPLADLPEAFIGWLTGPEVLSTDATTLPFWGLYNIGGEEGFYSS